MSTYKKYIPGIVPKAIIEKPEIEFMILDWNFNLFFKIKYKIECKCKLSDLKGDVLFKSLLITVIVISVAG